MTKRHCRRFLSACDHRRINRQHEIFAELMRHGATAETRTWARLRVLELEKALAGSTVRFEQGSRYGTANLRRTA